MVEGTPERAAGSFETALDTLRERARAEVEAIRAVGHRVVHGGTAFRSSVRVDASVRSAIEETVVPVDPHAAAGALGLR